MGDNINEKVVKCLNCGKDLKSDELYCMKCGCQRNKIKKNKLNYSKEKTKKILRTIKELYIQSSKKEKIISFTIIVIFLIIVIYALFFNMKINEARRFYNNEEYLKSGQSCKYLIPLLSPEIEKYKIAANCGVYYSTYEIQSRFKEKNSIDEIIDLISDLILGLYICQNQYDLNNGNYSEIQKDTIKYFQDLYYTTLNTDFYITRTQANEIINQYSKDDLSFDNMKTILKPYAIDFYMNKIKEEKIYNNPIEVSLDKLTSNSLYNVAEGTIANISSSVVYYVKIKVSFTDSIGKVIDTDWTYAVGSIGIAPGETKKFRVSVKKDYSITEAVASVLDFSY